MRKKVTIVGAGNVGAYAVQLARHAGLQVIATASAKDTEYVLGMGASRVVDYERERFDEGLRGVATLLRKDLSADHFEGKRRLSDGEMQQKYSWITRRRPEMTREELEEIANRWQLARQDVDALPVACDVQQIEHDMCRGWDDFSNDELARFYTELTGKPIVVV